MNVQDGLTTIRERLVDNDANPTTLKLVDTILQRAALPAASNASANSLLQLTRMLMRSPVAGADPKVYNDLVRVEEDLEGRSAEVRQRMAEDEARPLPKLKKHYRNKKD